jgi:ferrochelatase
VERGVERGVVLPLAAQDSRKSVGGYHDAARAAFAKLPKAPPFTYVHGFATHPLLLEAWAERVRAGLAELPGAEVLFTAHSLPNRVLQSGDPYPGEVRATCEGIARTANLARWELCYQSAAGQDWLGPDILDALPDLAKRGAKGFIVAPVGFVSDHLETLCDLDLEAAERARELGVPMHRCPALNDDARFIALLADVARSSAPR